MQTSVVREIVGLGIAICMVLAVARNPHCGLNVAFDDNGNISRINVRPQTERLPFKASLLFSSHPNKKLSYLSFCPFLGLTISVLATLFTASPRA